jgi:hypothetical protein
MEPRGASKVHIFSLLENNGTGASGTDTRTLQNDSIHVQSSVVVSGPRGKSSHAIFPPNVRFPCNTYKETIHLWWNGSICRVFFPSITPRAELYPISLTNRMRPKDSIHFLSSFLRTTRIVLAKVLLRFFLQKKRAATLLLFVRQF